MDNYYYKYIKYKDKYNNLKNLNGGTNNTNNITESPTTNNVMSIMNALQFDKADIFDILQKLMFNETPRKNIIQKFTNINIYRKNVIDNIKIFNIQKIIKLTYNILNEFIDLLCDFITLYTENIDQQTLHSFLIELIFVDNIDTIINKHSDVINKLKNNKIPVNIIKKFINSEFRV